MMGKIVCKFLVLLLFAVGIMSCNDELDKEYVELTIVYIDQYSTDYDQTHIYVKRIDRTTGQTIELRPQMGIYRQSQTIRLEVGYSYEIYPIILDRFSNCDYSNANHYHDVGVYRCSCVSVDVYEPIEYVARRPCIYSKLRIDHNGRLDKCNFDIKRYMLTTPIDTLLNMFIDN